MDKMILDISFNGLGDSLAFSTLPERCHENGIDFYLSNSVRKLHERNTQVFDIVWKANPYFKGFSDGEINAGNMYKSKTSLEESIVYQMERMHGFNPINKYPKIYIELKEMPEIKDITLIDLNSFAVCKELWEKRDLLVKKVDELIDSNENIYYTYLQDKPSKINDVNAILLKKFQPFPIDSLLHYCHVLNSVKNFVTVLSGANVLASAIKQDRDKQIDTIIWDWLKGTYYFENINYHTI
jgi:hypothetical protein